MKRTQLLFVLSFSLLSFVSHAQIRKGAVLLGGNVSAFTEKTTSTGPTSGKQNGVAFSPVLGIATKDNLVWGGSLSIGVSNYSNDDYYSQTHDYDTYGVGFFARKYKMIAGSNFYIFLQGGLNADYTRSEYTYMGPASDLSKRYSINVSAYPGISYAVSRRFQLESGFNNLLSLGYSNEKKYVTGLVAYTSKTNGFNIGSSLSSISSLYLGFRVLLN